MHITQLAARLTTLAVITALSLTSPSAKARTLVVGDLSQAKVQAAVDAAADGDTVQLPAGTATWNSAVNVSGKCVTLIGAGIDKTTIISGDFAPSTVTPTHRIFNFALKPGGLTRLSALTIDGGKGAKDEYNHGMLSVDGPSTTWRIDHVRIRPTRTCGMCIYASGGVIDHCRFDMVGWFFAIYGFNGGDAFGDISWTEAMQMGKGTKPFFVEDCVFEADKLAFALDGWKGERVVFRHNTLRNAVIGNHGTETSGRLRGARSFEIYHNTLAFTGDTAYSAIELRSGNGVIYDNTITGSVTHPIRVDNYRDAHAFAPWGIASGHNPFDKNDLDASGNPIIYDTGAYTGQANARVLTCAGKQWKPDQWRGYSLHNANTARSSIIESNTQDTITTRIDDSRGDLNLEWRPGDAFKIERCLAALDQMGRGKGSLITGGDDPQPKAWPRQEPEPSYIWNNTVDGKLCPMVSGSPHVNEGVDFHNKPMLGYKPFAYPHPLAK